MKISELPPHVLEVLIKLTSEGYDAVLVGGSVRNAIMGLPIKDWDVATSAAPVEVAKLFSKTVLTGEKFGTVTVVLPECSMEVTTFRTDGEYIDGRHPESVELAVTLHEDLGRRDFTINAIAMSAGGELIDPFDGIKDIKAGIIRCVGGPNTRFSEDALRMFRAFRFSAELGFKIEQETLQAIYANARLASLISAERVQVELEKMLMSRKPEVIGEMIKIGVLEKYVDILGKVPEGLDRISRLPEETLLRWSALCGILLETNYIRSATEILYTLHLPGKTVKTCLRALRLRNYEEIYAENAQPIYADLFNNRIEIKKLISKNDAISVRCAAAISEVLNRTEKENQAIKNTDEVLTSGECTSLGELAISGKDLLEIGHPPGRELGETLKRLLEHVIENPQSNKREALIELAKSINT